MANSCSLDVDAILAIFSEDPLQYSKISSFLSEVRKRFSPHYPQSKLLSLSPNNRNAANGQFVRFRGVIQNCNNCELYESSFLALMQNGEKAEMTGAFMDVFAGTDQISRKISEGNPDASRMLYTVSSIPGEAEWASLSHDCSSSSLEDGFSQMNLCQQREQELLVIRVYGEEKDFQIGDIIDLYGIYYEGMREFSGGNVEVGDENIFQANTIFHSPNVHVIEHRILSRSDLIPLPPPPSAAQEEAAIVYKNLNQFAISLTGCEIAANYFLSSLVARTYSWREELPVPLCSVPLAFLNVSDPKTLIQSARLLLPMVHVLPVTAELLEKERLFSWMDHQSGHLHAGHLQLSRGTLLILDFTHFTTAAIPSQTNFVRPNVDALQRLVSEQKLTIDYGVYKHGLEMDLSVMALYPALNTFFLKFPVLVPLPKPFTDGLDPVSELIALGHNNALQNMRWHLTQGWSRLESINLPRDEQMLIVESFSDIRKRLNNSAPEYFRNLLSLTRIRTALEGRNEMRNAIFQELLASEYKRLDRLKSVGLA